MKTRKESGFGAFGLVFVAAVLGALLCLSSQNANAWQVGVEWINDFPGTADDRDHWDESGDGFYNKVKGLSSWTGKFRWTNWSAWEKDFKRAANGGWEENYADAVDIAMVCTHGSTAWDPLWGRTNHSVYFGSTVDDHHVVPGDAYRSYGDSNLEWICFDSCSVLADRSYWYTTFDRLHLMLGFANTMYVISYGDGRRWAEYMIDDGWWDWPKTITQAWFATVDDLQPQGVKARVLAEVYDNYNDYLWGQGYVSSDPSYNGYYWYWDHTAGSEPALQTPLDVQTMTNYKVVYKNVTPEYAQKMADIFAITGEIHDARQYYYIVNEETGEVLTVDKPQGSFRYHNLKKLWKALPEPPKLPTPGQGGEIAMAFLKDNGLFPDDASYFDTVVEQQVEVQVNDSQGRLTEEEIRRIDINLQAEFARHLPLNGGSEIMASVMGPGAKLKVYIGDSGEIIGAHGGWKDVEPTGQLAILSGNYALGLLEQYGDKVTLAKHPRYDEINIKRATLGYYERAITVTVERLIPTWMFEVDFLVYPETVPGATGAIAQLEPYASGYIYLPATEDAIPLVATILNPADGQSFAKGDTIPFKGEARFGAPPYTYRWFSDADGYLGEGQVLNVNSLSVVIKSGSIVPHTITLSVSDAAGNSATDEIKVLIVPALCEGDFDCDGDVDGGDLAVFAADLGRTDCMSSLPPCEGDFEPDGDVDEDDLAVFAPDFGRTDCPPCTQACCLSDGDCVDVPPDVCAEEYGGQPQGAGSNCDSIRCPKSHQACCLPDGDCVDVPPDACTDEYGGQPQGPGTNCDSVQCQQPTPIEACCLPTGQCIDELPDVCKQQGGDPKGPGSSCNTDPC